jgi:hypothetical protein
MAQLGEVRCAIGARREGGIGRRAGAGIVAVVVSMAVIAAPTRARAQEPAASHAPEPAAPPSAHAPEPAPAAASPSAHPPASATPPAPAPTPAHAAEPVRAPEPVAAPAHATEPAHASEPAAAPESTEPPSRLEIATQERADCSRQLDIAEVAMERDYKYARNWTDAWYVTGASLIALNLTGIFQYTDYRRSEAIVFGALSTLLMIQVPTATTNDVTLKGIRAIALEDPCAALTNARFVMQVNADDRATHQSTFAYIFPIVLNVVAGGIVAIAEGHWEFAGHGDEGLSELVGIVAGELQVITYPGSSLKVSGSSFTMSF